MSPGSLPLLSNARSELYEENASTWMILLSEAHLRSILKSWVDHYNRGRPHSSLGLGVPDPPAVFATLRKLESRHRLGEGVVVPAKSVLGGLHHEYPMATPSVA